VASGAELSPVTAKAIPMPTKAAPATTSMGVAIGELRRVQACGFQGPTDGIARQRARHR